MNITELAEQIVFGRTMEDKLVASESVSFDFLPSSKLTSVAGLKSPGRPPGLRMPVSYTHLTLPTIYSV